MVDCAPWLACQRGDGHPIAAFVGFAALDEAQRHCPETPFLFVSGTLGEDLATEALKLGAIDYVLKQRLDRLVPAVGRALAEAEALRQRRAAERERDRLLTEARQARDEAERQALQLERLAQAAVAVTSAVGIGEVLRISTHWARRIVGASWAEARLAEATGSAVVEGHPVELADDRAERFAAWDQQVAQTHRPVRRVDEGPAPTGLQSAPMAYLAAPLTGRDGQHLGVVRLLGTGPEGFAGSDEAALVQLAQLAAVAIENIRFFKATQLARAEAEAANRMKDQFLATLSHELRTPLNAILGWATLLRSQDLPATEVREAAAVIERNTRTQAQLIDDLLDLSRIISSKLRLDRGVVDLRDVVAAALESTINAAQNKQIAIHVPRGERPLWIWGDAARLQQVAWNLISNAVKFTPAGGTIAIRTEQHGEAVELTVEDNGRGIDADFLPFVFDRFRQADGSTTREHGGLGLGLSIVRQLVELHGGTVEASSPGRDQGATFTVRLSAHVQEGHAAGRSNGQVNTASTPLLGRRRLEGVAVLLVDDEQDSLDLARRILAASGATVQAVTQVTEALRLLDESPPDVLVSDLGMPDRDGYDLIREVRLRGHTAQDLPAVAVTAFARKEDRRMILAAGYQVHLAKPVDPASLVEGVARAIQPAASGRPLQTEPSEACAQPPGDTHA